MTIRFVSRAAAAAWLVAASGAATAADMPARPVYKAPAVVAPAGPDWNGAYGGINAGYAWATSHWGLSTPLSAVTPFRSGTLRPDGGIGGGQIGYNWQRGAWLLGVEADLDYRNAANSVSIALPAVGFPTEIRQLQSREGWLGTIRPRAGVIAGNALIYATGGIAFGRVTDTHALITTTASQSFSTASTRAGWALGAGVEYALTRGWSAKIEYLHVDLGSTGLATPAFIPAGQIGFVPSFGTFTNHTDIVRIGLNHTLDFLH
jgi:outer membrane immunogenic protein